MRKSESLIREALASHQGRVGYALASMNREDVGWTLLSGGDTADTEPGLDVVKEHARRARQLHDYNTIVKRGAVVRNAYMWSSMPEIIGAEPLPIINTIDLATTEISLLTDGNAFFVVDLVTKSVTQVPLSRVKAVTRPEDCLVPNQSTMIRYTSCDGKDFWLPIFGVDVKSLPNVFEDKPVDKSKVVVWAKANNQVGYVWGTPDLMGAVYWAQAYKEYLEANHTLTKALARVAFKVSNINARTQKAVTSQLAGDAGRLGAVANMGMGQDLLAVNKSGAGINFSEGSPLAAMVSAALDVPLSILLTDGSAGGRQGAETALEDPTFKALDLRIKTHASYLENIYSALGMSGVKVKAPVITNDVVHRRMQSIALGLSTGMLHGEEGRALTLNLLNPYNAKPVGGLPPVPVDISVGALSDGTNDNRMNSTDA